MRVARACAVGCVISIAILAGTVGAATDLRDRLLEPAGQTLADLDSAQATWLHLHLDYYRVMFETEGPVGRCRQTVDVLHEEVVAIVENNCASALMTVSRFFETLRQRVQASDCRGNACDCRVTYKVIAQFDEQSGLPQLIALAPERSEVNVDSPSYWEKWVMGQEPARCAQSTGMTSFNRTMSIVGVLPLSRVRASAPERGPG